MVLPLQHYDFGKMIGQTNSHYRIIEKLSGGGTAYFGADSVTKMLGVLLLCAGLASCGSSAGNLTGDWQFTFKSSVNGNIYTGTASITQGGFVNSQGSGTERVVNGTVNFTNAPCATAASVSGTISGLNVILTATEDSQAVSLTGTVNAAFSAMSGSYSAPLGGCAAGDFGSWAASKS